MPLFTNYFKTMYEQAPIAYQSLDENGRIISVNRLWCEHLGYTPEEIVGTWFGDLLCEDSRALFRERFPQFKANGQVTNVPFRMITKGGDIVDVRFDGRIGYTDRGDFSQTHCVFRPFSSIAAETGTESSDMARFHAVFNSTNAAIIIVDQEEYRIVDANNAACALYGHTYGDLVRLPLDAISSRNASPSMADIDPDSELAGGYVMEHMKKDGTRMHVELFPSEISFGARPYIICFVTDITARIESERQLHNRLAEQTAITRLASLILGHDVTITHITDNVLDTARTFTGAAFGYVSTVDPATGDNVCHTLSRLMDACGVSGRPDASVVFQKGPDGTYPSLWGHSLNTGDAFFTNDIPSHPASIGIPAGHLPIENFLSLPVMIRGAGAGQICLANKDGGFTEEDLETVKRIGSIYALAIENCTNITAITSLNAELETRVQREMENRRSKEQLLVEQKKFADMGHMINAIAHQWRQPLNALGIMMQNLPDMIREGMIGADPKDQYITKAMDLIHMMSGTIDDFRNFFMDTAGDETFDLLDVTRETLSLVSAKFDAHGTESRFICTCGDVCDCPNANGHTSSCPRKATVVRGNPREMKQAMLNIYANATNAIIESGAHTGTVTTAIAAEDNGITITIEDTGGGIPEPIIDQIFTPYFTTREQGKGTGLGLSLVRNIIETRMGGSINAANGDVGARFTITLDHA